MKIKKIATSIIAIVLSIVTLLQQTQKADCNSSRFFITLKEAELFSVRFFKGSDTSCANVTVRFLSVFYVRNLLYVYLERSSRLTVRVAYVVTACLTFPANIAYS